MTVTAKTLKNIDPTVYGFRDTIAVKEDEDIAKYSTTTKIIPYFVWSVL